MEFLTAVLSPEHRRVGITLEENEDTVYLVKNGIVLERFWSTKVTIKTLHESADKFIKEAS